MSLRPLTAELDSKDLPVRRFLDARFTSGLRDVQRRYRQAAPPCVVSSADRQEANLLAQIESLRAEQAQTWI
jgi:hypothetical protein